VYFCFGVVVTVLMNYSYSDVEAVEVVNCLLAAIGCGSVDSTTSSAYKTCKTKLVGDLCKAARIVSTQRGFERVAENLRASLPNSVNTDNMAKEIIQAFREIIKGSNNVEDVICGYGKKDLLSHPDYDLFHFLSVITVYAIGFTENQNGKTTLKNLTESFFLDVEASCRTLGVGVHVSGTGTMLSGTVDDIPFDSVFSEVELPADSIKNGDLRVFCLAAPNGVFDYSGLNEYLGQIVGSYVFDRLKLESLADKGSRLGVEAMKAYRKAEKDRGKGVSDARRTQLGDMLLYIFLECVLKAPKVMSLVEFQGKKGTECIRSHGTHLLRLPDGKYQFVIGVSAFDDAVMEGLAGAIAEIEYIRKNINQYRRIASPNSLRGMVDHETMESIEFNFSLSDIRKFKNLSNSFGVFLGFSAPDDMDGDNYKELVRRMVIDLIPEIEEELTKKDLRKYPIYLYLLPFNDACVDELKIMGEFEE
jgi:hypothetical protein